MNGSGLVAWDRRAVMLDCVDGERRRLRSSCCARCQRVRIVMGRLEVCKMVWCFKSVFFIENQFAFEVEILILITVLLDVSRFAEQSYLDAV